MKEFKQKLLTTFNELKTDKEDLSLCIVMITLMLVLLGMGLVVFYA